jgi:pimeloyl-ACP methyl ester carboxylesterase
MNVLLLRGLTREQRHWDELPAMLEARAKVRTMMLDLPGTGTEHLRPAPATIEETAGDLRARFLAARGEGPHALVAISLGGMIAIDWCARHPEDFSHLVVINTSAGDAGKPWERLDWRNYGRVFRAAASWDPVFREETIIDLTINRDDFDRRALLDRWLGYARDRPVTRATLLRQLAAAARSRLPASLPVPTLVLASKADRLVRSVCSERIAQRLGAPIRLHDRAGHDLPFDDPAWVAEQVAEHIHRVI